MHIKKESMRLSGKGMRFSVQRNVLFLAMLQAFSAAAQDGAAVRPDAEGAGAPAAEPAGADAVNGAAQDEAAAAGQDAQQAPRGKSGSSAGTTQLGTITVTAQKKVENIQKVPISITAFGGEDLNDRKIETGGDLVTATPNVSFTKTNFASYNFQIRGIGTQALSVTTDPAVAVSFNSTPLIRNRLFEQEYFDVDRVEVLRGPQGTLYGRNATAGVVNMIPNLPNFDGFESWVKGEVGNFDSRRFSGMVNVPLGETFAFRAAGAWTDRSGYDYNEVTKRDVNGRSLWSGRLSLAWRPSERVNASIVWEHFDEDDDRSRTGKQLCHADPGPDSVAGVTPTTFDRNYFSQGCRDGSLYDDGAYGVPNGGSLPQVLALGVVPGVVGGLPDPSGFLNPVYAITPGVNPFGGLTQSRDLRKIATSFDPIFRAKNDVVQLNFDVDFTDTLKFVSQSLYTRDRYYSSQDYNRFQSNPVFNSTSDLFVLGPDGQLAPVYNRLPNGVYCDPQLGCSDRLLSADLTQSYSTQWSQEFRLQSSYDGPFNFSLGGNYLHYKVDESYYVFSNAFTLIADNFYNGSAGPGSAPVDCPPGMVTPPDGASSGCVYIDPNPLRRINGQGHNYFRSRNVAETKSAAVFGEGYWQLSDSVKLTTGLRFTDDRKITTPYPSQLLLTPGFLGGGYVNSGYPSLPDIHQKWNEWTGRVVLDWTPQLSFTDSTLFYVSAARGYKAGGTNSPGIGADPQYLEFIQRDPRFKPEYVNAIEFGMKNVLAGGKLVFNASLFYNDYKDYQISQIQDRATLNENYDAKTWGAELELAWKPTEAFQLSGNVGLLGTRLGSNQYSIDVMNRTQGNPDWVVVRPWIQQASNCIAPRALVAQVLEYIYAGNLGQQNAANILNSFCTINYPLAPGGFAPGGIWDGTFGFTYDPRTDAPNGGQGFMANVGGHSLPNAPHITVSLSPQYTISTSHGDWILRADMYYQGKSWARIYQDKIDRLHDWGNVNLSLTYQRLEEDLTVQLYVKNALNGDAITGTFTNSDDSGLTSNVFVQDPRIIGLSIRKGFY